MVYPKYTIMKKTFLLASILILMTGANITAIGNSMIEQITTECSDDPVIEIRPIPSGGPRTPISNPFIAHLVNDNYIYLESTCSFGQVAVLLVSSSGDYYTTVFYTDNGSVIIPISGNAGYYQLILTDASGQTYMGEFYL